MGASERNPGAALATAGQSVRNSPCLTGDVPPRDQIITRASDDAFRFKSVNRVIDGALQPDLDEVTLVRKSAEPVATAPDAAATQNASTPTGDQ